MERSPVEQELPHLEHLAAPAEVVRHGPAPRTGNEGAESVKKPPTPERHSDKDEIISLLLGGGPAPPAAERILAQLVAREVPLLAQLETAERELAERLMPSLEAPKRTLELARALKELVTISNALSRRVENVLSTMTTIRNQRRMLGAFKEQDGV